jgi:putative membrane protein
MKDLIIILKGFIIGSSMSVPGVSGGTMAILLGIYDKLISSISNFFKDIKGNLMFLMKFCLGGLLGIGSLAFVITWLLDHVTIPVSFFFLGAVVGGIPALYAKASEKKTKLTSLLYFIVGLVIVVTIGRIPHGMITMSSGLTLTNLMMWLVTGVIIAVALVLPGISTSHMLIVLGMYDVTLLAITEFDIIFLAVLGISVLLGIILITKPLEWVMNRFPHQTYWMIMGFVLGSTEAIFRDKIIPALPQTAGFAWWAGVAIISVITFGAGIAGIYFLSKKFGD